MSRRNTWRSKEDVLKDLAQVTGISNGVDGFIVRGERPPPPRRIEEDEEMDYRFRDSEYLPCNVNNGPDLFGISEMLRMVNEYNDTSADESLQPKTVDEIVTISKLNPCVAEFIPKSATSCSLRNEQCKDAVNNENSKLGRSNIIDTCNVSKNVNKCKDRNDSDVISVEKINDISKLKPVDCNIIVSGITDSPLNISSHTEKGNNEKDCDDIDIEKRIDISKLKPDEIIDITRKLRSKISGVSKSDNKRDRNVAIATLLKIYSAKSNTSKLPTPERNSQPILFTPEYFERGITKASPEETKSKAFTDMKTAIKDGTSSETINNQTEETVSSKESFSSSSNNHISEDPEVRQSIEKVTKWFEKPKSPKPVLPKPKGPVVFLGPISFKRKDSPKSPVSNESKSTTPTKSNATPHVAHYRPSKYAEDLSKMYSERNKVLDKINQDIWTRVEIEMKEKEERMRKERLEKSLPSSQDVSSSQEDASHDDNIDSRDSKS